MLNDSHGKITVTWNCLHLANVSVRQYIQLLSRCKIVLTTVMASFLHLINYQFQFLR